MIFLRMLLVLWVAAFLVLPECPCQLLGPLGVDFPHRHEAGAPGDESLCQRGPSEMRAAAANSGGDLPICHCHEGLGKTAEETGELELSEACPGSIELCRDESLSSLVAMMRRHSRAPERGRIPCFLSVRALSGVYRL